jgi:hypothetical protein
MGFLTGTGAAIDGLTCLRRWRIDSRNLKAKGYCSSSDAGPVIVAGNDDWTGMANAYGAQPGVLPGALFAFSGSDRNGSGYTGNAIATKAHMFWDVESADILYHVLYFAGRGALTKGANAVTDAGHPTPIGARELGLMIDNTRFSVRQMELEVENLAAEYADTSTAGTIGRAEGNYAARFKALCYYDDVADLPVEKTFKNLVFQTVSGAASTTGWNLKYAFIEQVITDINIEGDKEGDAYRSKGNEALIIGDWSAFYGTFTGTIIAPDATVIWPVQE